MAQVEEPLPTIERPVKREFCWRFSASRYLTKLTTKVLVNRRQ